jgi:hypothetical protein
VRAFRNLSGYEFALYGYRGFTKQPLPSEGLGVPPTHARLAAVGASARGNLVGGLVHAEAAYYEGSDQAGDQLRTLVGYTRELLPNLTGSVQYYAEQAVHLEAAAVRHMITTRLTYRMLRQTLNASLFAFASPDDGDGHLRPKLDYDWSDGFRVSAGANVMFGDDHTFFGQLARASNLYLMGRYSF